MFQRSLPVKVIFILFISFQWFSACHQPEAPVSSDPKIAALKLPPGFHADHLYSPGLHNQGSWVAMTFDNKGRMIASDQYGNLYRLTIPSVGADTVAAKIAVDSIELHLLGDTAKAHRKIGYAQGLMYAFNSLYVMVNDEGDTVNSRHSGLYRLQDTDNDDQYDKITLLKRLEGDGEHGPHSIVLGPDGNSIYIIAGNFTKIPKMDSTLVPPVWQIDNVLPFIKDPNGHDNSVNTHGGWIARTDSAGSSFTLVSSGFRNPFDLAFNDNGDLFTYDSDMEWDFGLPWYRPTRICHVPAGSDFGWRPGDEKMPPAYPDNVPPLLNIGQGSPTSVFSGRDARFPEKYRRSLFAFDWSFGIIYSYQLIPQGATYTASAEQFVSGSPLPLTDGMIGPDGALYFLTGGRRIESDLYRVYYGDNTLTRETLPAPPITDAGQTRRKLEAYMTAPQAGAIDLAWPYLKNEDRFIRYAARTVVEHQPVNQWQDKALQEKDPVALTQAAIALARQGGKDVREKLLSSLMGIQYSSLTEPQKIDLLRAFELVFTRMGQPAGDAKTKVVNYLDTLYPASSNAQNRGLSKLLVYLDDLRAIQKTMALLATAKDDTTEQQTFTKSSDLIMRNWDYGKDIAGMLANVPPQQQTWYATVLCQAKTGWSPELQEQYFRWFYKAFSYKGGHSFAGYLNLVRQAALKNVPKDRFAYFNTISGDSLINNTAKKNDFKQIKGPGRNWQTDTALAFIKNGLGHGDFDHGKLLFSALLCSSCHTMRGEGGNIGPDLTQLGTRFSYGDMLDAIITPSKTISDQFAARVLILKDGTSVIGRLVNEDADKYYISQNPFAPLTLREIPKKSVESTRLSKESIMYSGLINPLNPDELKDLLAYLKSGGNKQDTVYSVK